MDSSLARQPTSLDTEGQIEQLQAAVRADPSDAGSYALLGDAYYQRARETGDPSYYTRADASFAAALGRDPANVTAIAGQATLALARHDFSGGLRLARRAQAARAPDGAARTRRSPTRRSSSAATGPAASTLNRMVRLKANLTAYARISYFRELHGDLHGALAGDALRGLGRVGKPRGRGLRPGRCWASFWPTAGRYGAAEHAYRQAFAINPGYPPALAGIAGVEAGRGEFAPAIRRYREVVERLPLPEYAIALGETEQAAGRLAAARRDYALVGAEVKLLHANGVNTDVDLALFEANHGSSARAVSFGRRAWQQAPSVRSADAYAWALYRAGRIGPRRGSPSEAMRLGSRDPSFLYHAGMIARACRARPAQARRLLGALVAQSPRFSPLYAPRAQRALEGLR